MALNDQTPLETTPPRLPGGGFRAWFKGLKRFWRSHVRQVETAHLKHDIDKLEQERLREKTALLKQRRFYENLLRRRAQPSATHNPEKEASSASNMFEKSAAVVKPIVPQAVSTPVASPMPESPRPLPTPEPAPTAPVSPFKPVKQEAKPEVKTEPTVEEKPKKKSGLFDFLHHEKKVATVVTGERERHTQPLSGKISGGTRTRNRI